MNAIIYNLLMQAVKFLFFVNLFTFLFIFADLYALYNVGKMSFFENSIKRYFFKSRK